MCCWRMGFCLYISCLAQLPPRILFAEAAVLGRAVLALYLEGRGSEEQRYLCGAKALGFST